MEQRTGEALSALMDQEADDIDLQRVLNSLDGDQSVAEIWRRYHLASAAMHREQGVFATTDLSSRIRENLEQEPELSSRRMSEGRAGWLRPLASVAAAASVTAVILTSTQLYQSTGSAPGPVDTQVVSQGNVSTAVNAGLSQGAGYDNPMHYASAVGQFPVDTGEADAMARHRLEAYLHKHLENASLNTGSGLMPFARTVALEERH